MDIWLATSNRGKAIEFKTLLQQFQIHTLADLPVYSAPPENGKTFEDNARIKARSLKAIMPGVWVIGEDSGLEVEGLNHLPGVHSARYAGPNARDSENVAKILKMLSLRSAKNRKATFRSCMVVFSPEGKEHVITGALSGNISEKVRGTDGFGYDPIFIPDGETQTLAELGLTRKNQISHRGQAIRQLTEILK